MRLISPSILRRIRKYLGSWYFESYLVLAFPYDHVDGAEELINTSIFCLIFVDSVEGPVIV